MRNGNILRLTFALALSALVPIALSAQSTGCPWCTSPTTCSEVEENSDVGGCYNIGDGCKTISGSCKIEETFASAEARATLLEENGLEYRGTEVAEIWGTKIELMEIDGGFFAEWACDGRLSALFKKDRNGKWVELDPMRYAARFALTKGLTTRAE